MYEYGAGARRRPGPGAWLALTAALAAVVLMIGLIAIVVARSGGDVDLRSGSLSGTDAGQTGGGGGEDPTGDGTGDGTGGEQTDGQEPADQDAGGEEPTGEETGSNDGEQGSDGEPGDGGDPGDGGAGTAPLTFTLDLQGRVPFADRYAVHYSIDDQPYVYGFCGFSRDALCRADRLYTATVPGVPVGAAVEWHFTWFGSSDFAFGHGFDLAHSRSRTAAQRCAYLRFDNGTPTCTPDFS
jgi:hypothetical protein